jgi:hypothetical protein
MAQGRLRSQHPAEFSKRITSSDFPTEIRLTHRRHPAADESSSSEPVTVNRLVADSASRRSKQKNEASRKRITQHATYEI